MKLGTMYLVVGFAACGLVACEPSPSHEDTGGQDEASAVIDAGDNERDSGGEPDGASNEAGSVQDGSPAPNDASAEDADREADANLLDGSGMDATAASKDAASADASSNDADRRSPNEDGDMPDVFEASHHDAEADAGLPPPYTLPCPPMPGTSDALFSLYHVASADYLAIADSHLLVRDGSNRWALWDLDSHTQIAHGDPPCFWSDGHCHWFSVQGGGDYFVTSTRTHVEIRAMANGQVVRSIASSDGARHGIASDGSYVWMATTADLRIFSIAGVQLFSTSGNYDYAEVKASPSALLVVNRPPNFDVVERVDIASRTASTVHFKAQFAGWFADLGRFITRGTGENYVYTAGGRLEATFAAGQNAQFGGWRDFLWIDDVANPRTLSVRKVGSSDILWSQTFNPNAQVRFSAPKLAVLEIDAGVVHTLDLLRMDLGSSVARTPTALGFEFAARGDEWVVAGFDGPLHHFKRGAGLTTLNCGRVTAATAAPNGTWAFSFSVGGTILMKLPERRFLRALNVHPIGMPQTLNGMQFARDGTLLAMLSGNGLQVFDTASGDVVSTFPALEVDDGVTRSLMQFDIASSTGDRVALVYCGTSDCAYKVVSRDGQMTYLANTLTGGFQNPFGVIRLSPAGTKWTFARQLTSTSYPFPSQVFDDAGQVRTLVGLPMRWVDEDRILVSGADGRGATRLYSIQANGFLLPTYAGGSAIPLKAGSEVFTREIVGLGNAKYDTTTGSLLWRGPYWEELPGERVWHGEGADPGIDGAFSYADDGHAVYGLGASVYIKPH